MTQSLYSREQIAAELSLPDVVENVRRAFVEKYNDRVQMPAKNYLYFDDYNGDLRTMPAHVPAFGLASVKIVNAHPDNPANHDLPTVMALLVAIDPETGYPRAVLDGTELTALRTAAASALATRVFAPDDSLVLGLLGAGGQARYQLRGQLSERNFETVIVYDIDEQNVRSLIEWLNEAHPGVDGVTAQAPEDVFARSDVINSLTPSGDPLLQEVPERTGPVLINALGADAPEKREWPDEILQSASIVIDDWDQASHSGEISQLVENGTLGREALWGTLGQFLDTPPTSRPDRILFDSTGLAIQDTAAAYTALESSLSPGEEFSFF